MNGILVVQTAFLGDVVLTTPLLRELRRRHPDARIVVVAAPVGAAVLEGSPFADEIVPFDKRGVDRGPGGTIRLARRLRSARFDAAVAAQRSARTGLLARVSGARLRVGFAGASGAWAYDRRVPWEASSHAVRRYLALAGPLGGDPAGADPAPHLAVTSAARETAAWLLAQEGIGDEAPILALAPGSVWGTKRWTPEGYARVAGHGRRRGLQPVLVGAPEEGPLCERIAAATPGGVLVVAGRASIAETTAILARARALVTNDSGPAHVASAVGTPVVAIFGPTAPAFGYSPWGARSRVVELAGLACRPCHPHGPAVCPLGHHRCMRDLGAERVEAALDELLSAPMSEPDTPRARG